MDCGGQAEDSGQVVARDADRAPGFVCCGAERLAVATDSLDVVLLSHVLEFSEQPHEVLREVDRILIPEGHVIVVGFNPWSLWGLWRLVLGWRKKAPWCGKFINAVRLRDWLQLLGFDVVQTKGYFYRPPIGRRRVLDKLTFLERLGTRCWPFFSGGYYILAKKRVSTLTPIRPRWRPRRSGLVTPIASNSSVSNRNDGRNNL
jgi:SAM-dependent methyltransferase